MFKFVVIRFLGKCAEGKLHGDNYRDGQRVDNGLDDDDIDDRLRLRLKI